MLNFFTTTLYVHGLKNTIDYCIIIIIIINEFHRDASLAKTSGHKFRHRCVTAEVLQANIEILKIGVVTPTGSV